MGGAIVRGRGNAESSIPSVKPNQLRAHILPFGVFIGFLFLVQIFGSIGEATGLRLLADSKYWVYPIQTIACGAALVCFWNSYDFAPRGLLFATGIGVLALVIWIAPQAFFGAARREDGFDPGNFGTDSAIYWLTLIGRFARLVVVVPLVEEIFWRGFLMRYLVNEKFASVKFGTYTPLSFFGVAAAFMFVHLPADWPAAFATGILFGWVAVRTRSLFACVFAHLVTNLGLGVYIVATRQWGFW